MAEETTRIFTEVLADHAALVERCRDQLAAPFERLAETAAATVNAGGKLLLFGNGGSAADAQHIATELVVRFTVERAPVAALALTTDTSALTAIPNDLGADRLFARQIAALGRPGDLALGISTSGRSANVNTALGVAREMGLRAAALTGRDGGDLPGLADPCLVVPSDNTARIQEMHITLGHMLCAALERKLGLVPGGGEG